MPVEAFIICALLDVSHMFASSKDEFFVRALGGEERIHSAPRSLLPTYRTSSLLPWVSSRPVTNAGSLGDIISVPLARLKGGA